MADVSDVGTDELKEISGALEALNCKPWFPFHEVRLLTLE